MKSTIFATCNDTREEEEEEEGARHAKRERKEAIGGTLRREGSLPRSRA